MIHFVGAGPGAADLITLRGAELLKQADVVIYAGSLVNPELLQLCRETCRIYNSAEMTLEEVFEIMCQAERSDGMTVRLHTGDPSLYGAIREQMDLLEEAGIPFDVTPGVSSFNAAAAALQLEYTLPGVTQSVILTRAAGRTAVPERESVRSFAAHGASMVLFLSASLLEEARQELLAGGYAPDTPAAIVYKASWPQEKSVSCTVGTLPEAAKASGISRTALVLVGEALAHSTYERSRLYDPSFATGYRGASK